MTFCGTYLVTFPFTIIRLLNIIFHVGLSLYNICPCYTAKTVVNIFSMHSALEGAKPQDPSLARGD